MECGRTLDFSSYFSLSSFSSVRSLSNSSLQVYETQPVRARKGGLPHAVHAVLGYVDLVGCLEHLVVVGLLELLNVAVFLLHLHLTVLDLQLLLKGPEVDGLAGDVKNCNCLAHTPVARHRGDTRAHFLSETVRTRAAGETFVSK